MLSSATNGPPSSDEGDAVMPGRMRPGLSFLDLPLELRITIYEYCNFDARHTVEQRECHCYQHTKAVVQTASLKGSADKIRNDAHLLQVCRLIFSEALAVIYNRSNFELAFGSRAKRTPWFRKFDADAPLSQTRTNEFFHSMPVLWRESISILRLTGRPCSGFRGSGRSKFETFSSLRRLELIVTFRDYPRPIFNTYTSTVMESISLITGRTLCQFGRGLVEMKVICLIPDDAVEVEQRVSSREVRCGMKWNLLRTMMVNMEYCASYDLCSTCDAIYAARWRTQTREAVLRYMSQGREFHRVLEDDSLPSERLDQEIGRWISMREDERKVVTWSTDGDQQEKLCKITYCMAE